jgi:DNA-binding MarR family transcriptional regulator
MEQPNIFMSYLRVTQHMSQQFRSHFGRLDLTFPQALVLTVLGEDGPVPISALAERTGSANSTVSGIVDRLEKLGLAAQRDGPAGDLCLRYGEVQRPAGQGGH